jgi:hypothetical protein
MSKMSTALVIAASVMTAGLLSRLPLHAQPTPQSTPADRFMATLLQNRYSLSVRNGQFSGTGAQVLQSAIAQSRFVLLGENHGLAQNPGFAEAICSGAGRERFQTMAVEEGPLAAAELEPWVRRQDGLAQLTAFEQQFPNSLNIYGAREEFQMLQRCARAAEREFHLWGLNQEALGAGGFMLSRIIQRGVRGDAAQAMRQLLQNNDDADRKVRQTGNLFELFMISADAQDLARAAALLQKEGSPESQSLFKSLIESHEINRVPPSEFGNARRRERLMKTLFAAAYARAVTTAPVPPRVLLKFGAFHVYRGRNPVHGSGLGNYVAEFAEGIGAQSLHIRLTPVNGSGPVEPGSRFLRSLSSHLLQTDWTMFDLRPLRQDFNALAGAMDRDVATLVFGIDILVIVPEGTRPREIR